MRERRGPTEREEEELEQSRLADKFRGEEDATWKASNARLRNGTSRRKLCATLLFPRG